MNLRFDFDPAACGSNCNTNLICYIQMVRTYNFEEGTYSYISEEHEARAIAHGWYIDRLTGRNWGYYGRNNDGSFASTLTPGNNTNDAILFDGPRRPSDIPNIWWQAISATVSIDGGNNSCNNNILGYYFWSWFVDNTGTITDDYIIHSVAWENLQTSLDDAITAWNTQAPDIGHNLFPTFNKLMY